MLRREIRDLVNRAFSVKALLAELGVHVDGSQAILCPFHPDQRKSAKFYAHSNEVYCFAETKTFRAYDILKRLGVPDRAILKNLHKVNIKPPAKREKENPLFMPDLEEYLQNLKVGFVRGQYDSKKYLSCVERCMNRLF
jgi:hypothetical protein